jgi:ribosomal protein S18 acetylase RimI-like enzyme
LEIRGQTPDDLDALLAFHASIPEDERTFLKEEILDRETIESWLHEKHSRRGLACDGDIVVGVVAVVPLVGWSDHVGEIRLVVARDRRRSGIGLALARWALVTAIQAGLQKLIVEVVAEQEGAVGMFESLGFQPEALLRDHIRARDGHTRDLILLAHPVVEQWEAMATIGIDGDLA